VKSDKVENSLGVSSHYSNDITEKPTLILRTRRYCQLARFAARVAYAKLRDILSGAESVVKFLVILNFA
jgi:hypothetical protein